MPVEIPLQPLKLPFQAPARLRTAGLLDCKTMGIHKNYRVPYYCLLPLPYCCRYPSRHRVI